MHAYSDIWPKSISIISISNKLDARAYVWAFFLVFIKNITTNPALQNRFDFTVKVSIKEK
jgi:hypothetical protein